MLPFILASLLYAAPPPVILITIDGTRYQEVFNGTDHTLDHGHHLTARQLVPNLYSSFVDRGIAFGKLSPMVASGPNHISLPGYLEITRGHPSTDCQTNDCHPIIDSSIFFSFERSAVFASWKTIERTVPINHDVFVYTDKDWYRWDINTINETNTYLSSHSLPNFLWIATGDTDEWAHRNSYPNYIFALQQADAFIGSLVQRYPQALMVITVDHGRDTNFRDHGTDMASARVWMMIRGPGLPHLGFVKAKPSSLSNILPTVLEAEYGTRSDGSMLERIVE